MSRRSVGLQKVTLTLPLDLIQYADDRAAAVATNRSQVVGEALTELRRREEEEAAREGYAFFGRQSEEFASASAPAVSDALAHAG
jgi:metal-responsive CopG/Arc/MetJ family transcriptional regulator